MPRHRSVLTPKQKQFIVEYLIDLNATQAAIRAGYSRRSARTVGAENMTKPVIVSQIEMMQQKHMNRRALSSDYVIDGIIDTIERVKQIRPVLDKDGKQVFVETPGGELAAAYTFQPVPALKGYELLGKHLGMFGEANKPPRLPLLQDNRLQIAIQALIPRKSRAKELSKRSATDLQAIRSENADNMTPASVPQESTEPSVDNKAVTDAPDRGSVCQ